MHQDLFASLEAADGLRWKEYRSGESSSFGLIILHQSPNSRAHNAIVFRGRQQTDSIKENAICPSLREDHMALRL
jgi:hypothetical protein